MIFEIVLTLLTLIAAVVVYQFGKASIGKIIATNQLKSSREVLIDKILGITIIATTATLLVIIWGVDTSNLWLFATTVLGVIAIGFFAMWSMLSNVIAAVFIFTSNTFRIDDEIIILPDEIQGVVIDIKTFFVVLEDKDGNTLHIPNNLFFQKITKKVTVPIQPTE